MSIRGEGGEKIEISGLPVRLATAEEALREAKEELFSWRERKLLPVVLETSSIELLKKLRNAGYKLDREGEQFLRERADFERVSDKGINNLVERAFRIIVPTKPRFFLPQAIGGGLPGTAKDKRAS